MRSVFLKLGSVLFMAATFGALAQAPSLEWTATIDSGTTISDGTRVIRRMNNGDIIAASQVNTGPTAIRVTRHNGATGAVLWTRDQAPGTISNDTNDMVIDPATGDAYLASGVSVTGQGLNWYIYKVRGSDGVVQWSTSFNGPGTANDAPRSICLTSDGNVVVAGQYTLTTGAPSTRVAKYNASTGTQMWAFEPTTEWQDFFQVVADGAGNAITVGHVNAASLATENGYVVKFNAGGTVVWSQSINGAANDFDGGLTVDVDSAGNVYAAVESRVVPGMFVSDDDILVVKLAAATGVEQWRRSMSGALVGPDFPSFITLDASDNVYVGGAVYESSAGNTDALLAKLNSATGAVVWSITKAGTSGTGSELFRSIALNGSEVYAASLMNNTVSATAQNDTYIGRFNPASGATLWEINYNSSGTRNDQISSRRGGALIAGATDTVFVAGQSQNPAATQPDGVILKYAPAVVTPTASIAVAPASVTEDGTSNLVYTVTLDSIVAIATTVNITTTGTAAAGDYTGGVTTLNIPANAATATITIDPTVDGTVEADETVILTVATGTGYTVGAPASATGTILNDDLPTLALNDVSITEGNSGTQVLSFTVTRTGTTSTATGFNFTTADNSAAAGSDYIGAVGTGTIPAGGATSSTTVNVTINGDAIFENNESFFVNLSAPTNAVITDNQGIGAITNDDTAPSLAINDVSITEGNSGTQNLIFTVTRTGLTALPASFTAATAPGSATATTDYLAALVGSTSIAAGGATGTTTLAATINGDAFVELDETFVINLTVPSNATISDNQATGTITNDDTAGVVLTQTAGSTDVTEGGATDSYTLFLTSQPNSNVSIGLNPGTQVTVGTNPVVFTDANWNIEQTVTVTAVDDAAVEGPHTGTISHIVVSPDPTYSGVTVGNVVANITDNDPPTLAINDVSITEGNSGTQVLTFTVTRTGTTASASGFSFATANNTATTADSDYVAATGTGTIPAGGATGTTTVSVTINGDAIFENNESFYVNLTAPTNAVITDAQGLGTITNDDTAPTLAINDVSITEGNSGTQNMVFTVTRLGLTALPASFTAATANGTASAPSDYLAALVGSTSIAAGGATGTTTLTATINGDSVVELDETFVINLTAPSNATIFDNQATGTITNDDTSGIVLTQFGGSTDVTEGGTTDTYSLVLTSQPTSNVSIALNPGTQVTVATSPVVFTNASWNIAQTVTVTAVDDVAVEGPHTGTISHNVTSGDAVYNNFTMANVVANITDNDLPTLAINDVSITEGNAGTQVLNFTVTRTGSTPFAVGFDFATADNSATTVDSDYIAASGTGTIPSGGTTASTTVSVTINGDAVFENNESFFNNLSSPTNALISDAQGVGTITNDETAPSLAINDVSIVEGNSGTQNLVFTVTRTGLTALPASFTAAAADGTASAPADYLAALVGATTIAAGGATGTTTLTATINGDLTIEPNETFTVNLSAPVNATFSGASGTGTITNDDGEPTFTPAGPITRQQGSPAAIATLGTVSDLTDPANSLAVAIIANTTTGVTTTGLANSNGTATASLAASCSASAGSLSLRVTDSGGLTDTDTVQINVSANTPPALTYGTANVSVGNSLTITPTTALSDNGTVTSIAVQSSGTYTGGISVSASGVISLSNATPAGNHTLLIRATDNCGENNDVSVALNIGQASTFKLITSNVAPSRFGEAVTFSVALSGVNPSGTVEFFAGTTSLGTAPLVASPSGGANLKLANLTLSTLPVGTSVITARYAGDVNNVASVSADLAHIVNSAGTRITLTPAANPAPVGNVSIGVLVAPEAPGGGVPAGSVTLSSGALNCTAPLTAGAGSCSLNFASVGYQAITANYTPTGSNHAASIGGSVVVIVSTPSSTDLRVRIGNGVSNIGAGQALSYLIVVDNLGTQAAVGRLQVPVSADFVGASYTCISAALANCAAAGTGNIDQELSLAPGGVVIYRLNVTAPLAPERVITQTASITAKTPTTDPDATNNSAADIDPMGLLADGYEDAAVTE